tara:strand:+ start:680 stop:2410 length:1731 start_codon:yes stop_codon:yes gene_type:complete
MLFKNNKKIIDILISLILFFQFLFIIFNLNKGLDFTDESFNLLRSLYPSYEIGKLTYFGFINNYFLNIFDFNLTLLKLFSIIFLSTLLLFFSLSFNHLLKLTKTGFNFSLISLALMSLIGVINFYSDWTLTPSYNFYNFLGIVLFLIGLNYLFIYEKFEKKFSFLMTYFTLFQLSFLICGVTKPSTFIILLFVLFISFLIIRRSYELFFKYIFILVTNIFFIYLILKFFDSSLNEYLVEFKLGSTFKAIQDPRYEINFILFGSLKQVLFYFYSNYFLFILVPIIFLLEKRFFKEYNYILSLYLFIILILYKNFFIVLTLLSFYLFLFKFKNLFKDYFINIFFPIILIGTYFAFSLGTNANFVLHLTKVDVIIAFIFIILFQLLNFRNNSFLKKDKIVLIFFLTIVTLKFFNGINNPMRLNATIFEQKNKIEIAPFTNSIFVDSKKYNFIVELREVFKKNGWQSGNYLIDWSGRTPGTNLILNAKYISRPWWLGGYVGSDNFAKAFLQKSDKQKIKDSWIIIGDWLPIELNKSYGISVSVLEEFGVNLETEYTKVDEYTFVNEKNFYSTKLNIYKPN